MLEMVSEHLSDATVPPGEIASIGTPQSIAHVAHAAGVGTQLWLCCVMHLLEIDPLGTHHGI